MKVLAGGWLLALVIGEGSSVADWLLTVAACITALGVIHLFLSRSLRFTMRLGQAVDVMLETPSWQKQMDTRVTAIEEKLGLVREESRDAGREIRELTKP